MNTWRLFLARHHLLLGGVIAYPTEGVWGLGCLPDNMAAVMRILDLKGRSVEQGLILVAADLDQLSPYHNDLDEQSSELLRKSCPGPLTWLIPHSNRAPHWITGKHDTLAVRVTQHLQTRTLCQLLGGPLVSTSANPSGSPAAKNMFHVRRYFGTSIDYLLPGELGGQRGASEIRDLATNKVVRSA